MKCNKCRRRVRDSFSDKLLHVMQYHPEMLLTRVARVPEISRSIGEQLAELLKGKTHELINR